MAMNCDVHQHDAVAQVFRALAEPARLSLVHCLADGPHRVGELSGHLGLAQSTVSAHLVVLRSAGLVAASPEGRATLYRLAHPGLDDLLHAGERLLIPGVHDHGQGHHPGPDHGVGHGGDRGAGQGAGHGVPREDLEEVEEVEEVDGGVRPLPYGVAGHSGQVSS